MMCIIFINILSTVLLTFSLEQLRQIVKFLSTVSLDIFVGTIKQIVKFISYLTTVTNSTLFFHPLEYLTIVFAGLAVYDY